MGERSGASGPYGSGMATLESATVPVSRHDAPAGNAVLAFVAAVTGADGSAPVPEPESAQHPTLGRGYLECAYAPMVELLPYLEANGVLQLHRLDGGRDCMRRSVTRCPASRASAWSAAPRCSSTRAT